VLSLDAAEFFWLKMHLEKPVINKYSRCTTHDNNKSRHVKLFIVYQPLVSSEFPPINFIPLS
jgi:hypothetical protein